MPITLWTQPACVQCKAVSRAFDNAAVTYEKRDLTDPANARKLETFKQQGYRQAPITESPAGTFTGFNPDKVNAAITAARAEQNTPGLAGPTMTGPGLH